MDRNDTGVYVVHYMRWFDGTKLKEPINKVSTTQLLK
jgi:hypothetical protein